MTIGERLKQARLDAGLTQRQLGDACGIDSANIRKYETNRQNPKHETLEKIAAALGVDINWLRNGQTLEQRDQKMKDYVSMRFAEAELDTRLHNSYDALSLEGKQKAVESVEIIAGNPNYQKPPKASE